MGRSFIFDKSESVDLELALEGAIFRVVEILWHYYLGELLGIVDLEYHSVGLPRRNAFVALPCEIF
jgi:hypothetical protein